MSQRCTENAFAEMRKRHRQELKVEWMIRWVDDHWYFSSLRNRSGIKGNGAVALREICALADKVGEPIVLWTGPERLYSYYEQFGFKQIGRKRCDAAYEAMFFRREPLTVKETTNA
jgi:hypothetical protein